MRYRRNMNEIPRLNITEFTAREEKHKTLDTANSSMLTEATAAPEPHEPDNVIETPTTRYLVPIERSYRNYSRHRNRNTKTGSHREFSLLKRERKKTSPENEEDRQETISLLKKAAVSAAICAAVLLFRSIDTPFTNDIIKGVKTAITSQLDIDKTLGKLKFVSNYLPDVAYVFADEEKMPSNQVEDQIKLIAPVKGKVVQRFGASLEQQGEKSMKSQGISIEGQEGAPVYAAADGEVIHIGENSELGSYVRLKHENGMETLYGNCVEISVKVGDRVAQKDQIGKVGKSGAEEKPILYFEARIDGEAIDPIELMDEGNVLPR